jgi:hypothetical protein
MSDETLAVGYPLFCEKTEEKHISCFEEKCEAIETDDLKSIERFTSLTVFDSLHAAKCGRLRSLKKLFKMGCPWDWQTTAVASMMGNLDILQFAFENGCQISVHCASQAALFNHKHVLRFVAKHNFPVDWRTPANAFLSKNCCADLVQHLFPGKRQTSMELKALREPLDNCAQLGLFHIRPMSLESRLKRLRYK